ncbi:hypothetical protein [Streptomyces pathocidini]|uniref:hypothetical protein n=1 Tax=Streptomyces pathocidini TaxID=1650571 RepID=UPI0006E22550|nr:hypothetical protein [Streptomyces pathocidini]
MFIGVNKSLEEGEFGDGADKGFCRQVGPGQGRVPVAAGCVGLAQAFASALRRPAWTRPYAYAGERERFGRQDRPLDP